MSVPLHNFATYMPEKIDETSEQIRERLSEAAGRLAEAREVLGECGPEIRSERPNVYRLEGAVDFAEGIVMFADPRITSEGLAAEVTTVATNALEAAQLARQGSGEGNLIGVADELLAVVRRVDPIKLASDEDAKAATLSFRQSFGPRMRKLENEISAAQSHFDELRQGIQSVAEDAEARLNAVSEQIEAEKARVDELISAQEGQFAEAQAKRAETFKKVLGETEADLSAAKSLFESRALEAREHITELEGDISKTAAALGGEAVGLDNSRESVGQAKVATFWTVLTILLAVGAAGIPLALGVESSSQSTESLVGKITIGLILAGAAGYTAGVARHHRQRAATARRLAIELNAFGPFIAELPKDDRDDLRSTIVWRFFGPPDSVNQDVDGAPEPGPGILTVLGMRRKKREPPPGDPEA